MSELTHREAMDKVDELIDLLKVEKAATPPLRGVQVYDCKECAGRGRIHHRPCTACNGRRVVIIQHGEVVDLDPPKPPGRQGRWPDPGEIG